MKHKYKKLLLTLIVISIAFLGLSHFAFATDTVNLTGKVTDGQGHYVGFADVAVVDPNTNQKLTDTVSNTSNGTYLLTPYPGTYTILVTPTSGNAFQQKTITNVEINADTELNITLDPSPGSVALTGKILAPDGQPIPNVQTSLSSQQGGVNFITDSSGTYFLRVFPRNDYTFLIYHSVASSEPTLDIPGYFRITTSPFSLTQDLTQDITIPTAHIYIHVTDPYGNAAPNVSVTTNTDLPASFYQNNIGYMIGTSESATSGNSDNNGNVTLKVLPSGPNPGNYIITAYPQSGPYFDNRIIANDEIIDGLQYTITLSTMPTLYGRFISGNNPVGNQTVELSQSGSVVSSVTSDDQGNYYTKVPIGNYTFTAHSNGKIPFGPASYIISGDLNLSTSKQIGTIWLNGFLVGNVTIKVRDAVSTTTPIAAHVVANGFALPLSISNLTNVIGVSNDEADTDDAGNARLYLFNTGDSQNNGYTITAFPNDPSYLSNSISNFLFNGGVETTIYVNQAPTPTPTVTPTPEPTATPTPTETPTPTPTPIPQLTALNPAKVWVGLKNSDDVGVKFDLKAEVYAGSTLVSSGELDTVNAGSSGFNNAKLDAINFHSFSPINFPSGSTLSIKLYVRNACIGSRHSSGTARLWYNDSSANSKFGATIGANINPYYLVTSAALSTSVGSGPKRTVDVAAGARCSPFKLFGTWTTTP